MRRNHVYYIVAAAAFAALVGCLCACLLYQTKRLSSVYTLSYLQGNTQFVRTS